MTMEEDVEGGQSRRISDGQFNYLTFCVKRKEEQDYAERQERNRVRRQRIEEKIQNAQSNSRNTTSTPGGRPTTTETVQEKGLLAGMPFVRFFTDRDVKGKNYCDGKVTGSSNDTLVQNRIGEVTSSLNQTKDAFNERGERLSTLSEKTRALKDACSIYSKEAHELKKSQRNRGWLF